MYEAPYLQNNRRTTTTLYQFDATCAILNDALVLQPGCRLCPIAKARDGHARVEIRISDVSRSRLQPVVINSSTQGVNETRYCAPRSRYISRREIFSEGRLLTSGASRTPHTLDEKYISLYIINKCLKCKICNVYATLKILYTDDIRV